MTPKDVEAVTEMLRKGVFPEARHRSERSQSQKAIATDKKIGALLMPSLGDPKTERKLADLQGKANAQRAKARGTAHEKAAATSEAARREISALAERRFEVAQALADLPPPVDGKPLYYLIKAPYLIWPSGIFLDSSEVVDGESYAKFRVIVDAGQQTTGKVQFLYYWTNPETDSLFISIDVFGIWNGLNDAYLNGGLFSEESNDCYVQASLEVLPTWIPNSGFTQDDQRAVFTASLRTSGLYSGFQEKSELTHSGVDLRITDILIPAKRTVVFSMTASVSCSVFDDGGTDLDYSTGAFQFGSPFAFITVTGRVVSP